MDLGFFRRARQGFTHPAAAPLDYSVLVATLAAMQSATAAARAERLSAPGGHSGVATPRNPLVALLLCDPDWREAAAALGGRFSNLPPAADVKAP